MPSDSYMNSGKSFSSERVGSTGSFNTGSMYSSGSSGSGGSTAAERGSGAVCVHSKKFGHKHPVKNWQLFLSRLQSAMEDLNDPEKEAAITKKF